MQKMEESAFAVCGNGVVGYVVSQEDKAKYEKFLTHTQREIGIDHILVGFDDVENKTPVGAMLLTKTNKHGHFLLQYPAQMSTYEPTDFRSLTDLISMKIARQCGREHVRVLVNHRTVRRLRQGAFVQ